MRRPGPDGGGRGLARARERARADGVGGLLVGHAGGGGGRHHDHRWHAPVREGAVLFQDVFLESHDVPILYYTLQADKLNYDHIVLPVVWSATYL